MSHEIPLYAVINCFGNGWTVIYKPYGSYSSINQAGYGAFPVSRFPGVPVVDLSTTQSLAGLPDGVTEQFTNTSLNTVPLSRYLEIAESIGATVYYA